MFLKKVKKTIKKIFLKYSLVVLIPLLIFFVLITALQIYTSGKINPGVNVSGINIGNLTKNQALNLISSNIKTPKSVNLINDSKKYQINLEDFDFSYNYLITIDKAYLYTHTGNLFYDLGTKIKSFFKGKTFGLEININDQKLATFFQKVSSESDIKPIEPKVSLINNKVVIEKGKKGKVLDQLGLRIKIGNSLSFQENSDIEIPFQDAGNVLDDFETATIQDRANSLIGKSLFISFKEFNFKFNDQMLISFLDTKNEYSDKEITKEIEKIALEIDREPQNSVFVFEDSKVKEFTPSSEGYAVQIDNLKNMTVGNLRSLEQSDKQSISFDILVTTVKPKIQNKDVNDLGIEILLGRGSSKFVGSIPNRIHNISLASSRFKGILVAPNETFSFNQALGEVNQETGFKQAYIIKEGKTILGDGGGVCQVSTTFFRAALNTGLPILERQAHAYRVGYYEQDSPPGLDATVYGPHPDLIIKNDTPKHLLIQSIFDSQKSTLVFEIYGTSDGRKSTITKPIISSTTPPADDLYQDDPTLPLGTIKQVEHKAWGAKVKFDYLVERNGEVIYKKTFYSNYQPWQAVYLRGTKPL